jgi:hypothetical protein
MAGDLGMPWYGHILVVKSEAVGGQLIDMNEADQRRASDILTK